MRPGKRTLRLTVGLAVSLALVVLMLRVVDPRGLGAALAASDLRLLIPAVGLYFVGLWVRSVRWRLLLPAGAAPTGTLFRALAVGFTVNNLLPARLGELARAYLLATWRNVPAGATLASVVVERVLDGLALAALLLGALLFVPTAPAYLLTLGLLVGGAFTIGALLLALVVWRTNRRLKPPTLLARLPFPGLVERLGRLLNGFADGLRLIRGADLLARLAALSLLGWTCELGMFYVLLLDHPTVAALPLAVVAGAAANFATLIPSSPGYVGTFDAVLVKVVLDLTPLSADQAAAYAVLAHAALFLPVVAFGALVLWQANVGLAQLTGARGLPTAPTDRSAAAEAARARPASEPAPVRATLDAVGRPADLRG